MADLLPRLRVGVPADQTHLAPASLFDPPVSGLWCEIGFGGGEHLAAQAASHPGIGFIGCEPFENGVASLLSQVQEAGLANVRVFDDDARLLLDALPDCSLDRVFILFPDPWPKARHWKRRIFSAPTLDRLARVMKPGADLYFATDHMAPDGGYLRWALGQGLAHPAFRWMAEGPEDWRGRPAGWVRTRYEQKALDRGERPVCLHFQRV